MKARFPFVMALIVASAILCVTSASARATAGDRVLTNYLVQFYPLPDYEVIYGALAKCLGVEDEADFDGIEFYLAGAIFEVTDRPDTQVDRTMWGVFFRESRHIIFEWPQHFTTTIVAHELAHDLLRNAREQDDMEQHSDPVFQLCVRAVGSLPS